MVWFTVFFLFDLKDYITKQAKFSIGNVFSVPVGTLLLFLFTNYLHVFYIYSSLLSLCVTTVMNFWIQHFLKVIPLKKVEP